MLLLLLLLLVVRGEHLVLLMLLLELVSDVLLQLRVVCGLRVRRGRVEVAGVGVRAAAGAGVGDAGAADAADEEGGVVAACEAGVDRR